MAKRQPAEENPVEELVTPVPEPVPEEVAEAPTGEAEEPLDLFVRDFSPIAVRLMLGNGWRRDGAKLVPATA
jgi:hypothetical protein